ncbi:hypothetical protein H9Q69_014389, partial [Fusarium xylarioides]
VELSTRAGSTSSRPVIWPQWPLTDVDEYLIGADLFLAPIIQQNSEFLRADKTAITHNHSNTCCMQTSDTTGVPLLHDFTLALPYASHVDLNITISSVHAIVFTTR